jgi:NAD+ synthase
VQLDERFRRDYSALAARLADWTAGYVRRAGFSRVVIGVSGGVDSALSAALAARALGAENVHGLLLPHAASDPASERDGRQVCEHLGLPHERLEITTYCAPLLNEIPESDRIRRGNIMARMRMIILFDYSEKLPALVLGTGNKTEILLGYTTLHGDDACGLDPLAELYKTEVWELARELDLPPVVIDKAPTADLWAGQTDEGELGISYRRADRILYDHAEQGLDRHGLISAGHPAAAVDHLLQIVERTAFKRRLPAHPPRYR